MERIPLADFCEAHGQTAAAKKLCITQGALSKALRIGRKVDVITHRDGSFSAEEIKPFPSQSQASRDSEVV
ncbi:Cro/CI family transcriptional regulator [Pseudomonas rossensis]|uniref:Cro/CI family transcriptional regulator n=1 Tax=Pseudomonas rossensis TaxID=2305471 RepID=UPI0032615908